MENASEERKHVICIRIVTFGRLPRNMMFGLFMGLMHIFLRNIVIKNAMTS